ncbi:MAG TPA: type II toxin-antitoxin system VapB family antitoxin [Thermoanaerobaculia bacterium]|nr:type II toxin-antitoxin system VapB family antitoxin [Thermoanaerobaculia bacterium]
MSSRKTSVEIDEELLGRVRVILSTATIRETIEEAFREVVRQEARRQEVEALRTMSGLDLDDPAVMERAWRR